MSEPARVGEGFRRELATLAGIWLQQHQRHCDWCRKPLQHFTDLDAYLEFCSQLGALLPPTRKRLPEAKIFCADCAGGAISELIDGIRYVVGNSAGSDPWERQGVAR